MQTTTNNATLRAQLDHLARERGRELCGRCGGIARRPCSRCVGQRARAVELYDADEPVAVIAATIGLPCWRTEQILREQLDRDRDRVDERVANAELLRPELGALIDVILAGPSPADGCGWQFDNARHWHQWVALSLELVGWNIKAVNSVLNGTHIPNAALRARLQQARATALAGGEPLSSQTLAAQARLTCGTYIDRLLGLRPTSANNKHGRSYGGRTMKTIPLAHAARIADALGVSHDEIPGL